MKTAVQNMTLAERLEDLYRRYNRRAFVHPDPIEFLYEWEDLREREIVALVAATLAYGRVRQILTSVKWALEPMGPSPRRFLERSSHAELEAIYADFKHRVVKGRDLAHMLFGTKAVIERFGSLEACFLSGVDSADETVVPAMRAFVDFLVECAGHGCGHLLPAPASTSACKRVHLFLRWMVRRDAVDPGGWVGISPAKLVVPLDTHMHRIARDLAFTERRQADLKTALEVTAAFRRIRPDDPVRYDFTLTRLGIRDDTVDPAFLLEAQSAGRVRGD